MAIKAVGSSVLAVKTWHGSVYECPNTVKRPIYKGGWNTTEETDK